MEKEKRELHDRIVRDLMDRGRLIEAGFQSLRLIMIPVEAPVVQVMEMRKAFFAGAQHLFASIMSALESGEEATDKDLRRMSLIQAELDEYVGELKRTFPGDNPHGKPQPH